MPEEFLNEKPVAALADLDLDADASAFMPICQSAKTVYVDATYGNDSTGTKGHPELPYATLDKAASVASAGDTIIWHLARQPVMS